MNRMKIGVIATALAGAMAVNAAAFGAGAAPRTLSAADKAHIAAIENGLLPAVIIKGRPAPTATLAERMRETKVPGVSIVFFDHGRIVWAKGYGLADIASGRPVTPDTLFEAGSISKPVAALAALRLVQDGRLDLDQDVNARLKAWRVPENSFTTEQKVTLRRLLSHGAGLTVHGFPGYTRDQKAPSLVQILNGQPPANTAPVVVDTVPGTRWAYSGGGYVIAQLLMTETTGEPFPDLLRQEVFSRAGMTHSTYEQPLPERLHGVAASGYQRSGQPVSGDWYVYPEMAPAGLWTTPSDLARAAIEVQNDYAGRSHRLLSKTMARQMLTRQIDHWGLGFQLTEQDGTFRFGHGGDDEGFKADLEAFTTGSGQGVAIMTNGDAGSELIAAILRTVAATYGWKGMQPEERTVIQLDPALLTPYVGHYQIPGVTPLTVTVKDGALYVVASALGPDSLELLAQSPSQFFNLSSGISMEFVKDASGAVSKIVVNSSYGHFEAARTP